VLVDDDSESGTPSLAEQQMIYESMTSVSLNHNDVIQKIGGRIMERLNRDIATL
jgi:hypothetical protein